MTIPFYNSRRVVDNTGSVTNIALTFLAEAAADVHLYAGVTSNILIANQVELVQGVDYTVSGIGTLSLVATLTNPAGWSDYQRFALVVDYPVTQPNDVDVGGPFGLRFENALDRQTYMLQSFFDEVSRAIKVPVTFAVGGDNTLESAPGQLIGWNSEGSSFQNYPTVTQSIQAALDAAIDAHDAADEAEDWADVAEAFANAAGASARNDWHYIDGVGDGVTTDVPLAINPGSIANVWVSLGGLNQHKSTMSLVNILGVTNVRFSSPLPNGVAYEIAYGNANAISAPAIPDASLVSAKYAPGSVGSTALADNGVTLAKLADIATLSLLGRKTAATGDPEVLSLTDLRDLFLPNGSIIDSASVRTNTRQNFATTIPNDNTIPQITEGSQIFTLTLTPKSVTNKFRVRFHAIFAVQASPEAFTWAFFVNGAANAAQSNIFVNSYTNGQVKISDEYEFTPGVTTAVTITIRGGSAASAWNFCGNNTDNRGGTMYSSMTIEEIKA